MPNTPNLFIVGAPRSGTTSLYHYLRQHDNIFFSAKKEPRHFQWDYYKHDWYKNIKNNSYSKKEDYLKLFETSGNYKYYAEASPSYLYAYKSASQIKNEYPDAKILIILRNPIDRCFSNYTLRFTRGVEKLSFEECLEYELPFLEKRREGSRHFIREGLYSEGINAYKKVFGENVKIFLHDDLKSDANSLISSILDFLELEDNNKIYTNFISMQSKIKKNAFYLRFKKLKVVRIFLSLIPLNIRFTLKTFLNSKVFNKDFKMNVDTRKKLINIYKYDILKTSKLINKDLNHWLS